MHPIINKEICLITNSFVQDEEVSIDYGITWTSSSNLVQSVTGDGNKLDLKVDMIKRYEKDKDQEKLPFLPVNLFKSLDLFSVKRDKIIKIMKSIMKK